MSIETFVFVDGIFPSDELAKKASDELVKSLSENEHELASSLHKLYPVENQIAYKNDTINVEDIKKKNNVLSINAYTYTSEEPTWFAYSFYKLGATKIQITVDSDGYRRNFYFIDGKNVSKKKYISDKPKKQLSAKDIEINKNLFLPEGRVTVKAKLVSTWPVGDIWESVGLKFETLDGDTFYHKGRGQLIDVLYNNKIEDFDTSLVVEFDAAFERGRIEDEYVSFAKRPTKINVHK